VSAISTANEKDRDEGLVRQFLEGNTSAFQDLVRIYQRRISALGMGFFKNLSDTEDFVQDVFAKLYSKLSTFRGESRFSTWCTRLAYNTAINSLNRRKEYESISSEEVLPSVDLGPEERHLQKVTVESLRKVMKELPEHYALAVDLYFFHDLPYKEISAVMALPVNTIKSHIFRAKKILRDKLGEYFD
jgi:RNA polymerase sigma-70 factor (ECF subfamily)